jgi:diguanylate cyclase (GGDEF)-like protein
MGENRARIAADATGASAPMINAALANASRKRLLAAFVLVMVVAMGAIWFSLAELSDLSTAEYELTAQAMPYERQLAIAALAAKSASTEERAWYLTNDDVFLQRMRNYSDATVSSALDAAGGMYPAGSIHERAVQSIRRDYQAWLKARDENLAYAVGNGVEAIRISTVTQRPLRLAYEEEFDRAIELSRSGVNDSHLQFVATLVRAKRFTVLFSVAAVLGAILLLAWVTRALRSEHRHVRQVADEEASAHAFERQLNDAMEMAESPADVYGVVGQALPMLGAESRTELLLADSSEAHLHSAASSVSGKGCPVTTMWNCPAIRRGRVQLTSSSDALDACPRLREGGAEPCSAVCTPVMFMGKAMGVLHTRAPDQHEWSQTELARVRLLGAEAGTRLGVLRAMAQTELQASTDSLTGLANRRTLEASARDLVRRGVPYVVAMCDLDHFKVINDTYGHDSGDRAIRRFARVLKQHVRKFDLVARFGGDEFVIVLPEIPQNAAVAMLERVRSMLAQQDGDDQLPEFTASFGVCSSAAAADFKTVLDAADQALLQAKRAGRDRVVFADTTDAADTLVADAALEGESGVVRSA